MFVDELSVAKIAKCMLRENNRFMVVFDLTVAEVAEVAGFTGGKRVLYLCGIIARSKSN